MQPEIQELCEQFKFTIELEAKDERVMYLRFEDGRGYRLEHPGALAIARLFSSDTNSLTSDCLEYFIQKCILPIAETKAKTLNAESLSLDETMDLWLPFAWRWLRRGIKIVTG